MQTVKAVHGKDNQGWHYRDDITNAHCLLEESEEEIEQSERYENLLVITLPSLRWLKEKREKGDEKKKGG